MKNSGVILEVQFCPPISYFRVLLEYSILFLEKHENYQKRSYRNRCEIAAPHGRQTLSVPLVKGKNQQTPITEVKISYDQPWQKEMWHALETAYRRSPFFEFYEPELKPLFFESFELLFDLDRALTNKLLALIQMKVEVQETNDFCEADGATVLSDSIRPAHNSLFIEQEFPAYTQVFSTKHDFIPDLSILDLLFNIGPESILYLHSLTKPKMTN